MIRHVRRKAASRCDLVLHIGSGCCRRAFSTLANETVTKFQLGVKTGTVPFSFRKEISLYPHKSVSHCLNCKDRLSFSLALCHESCRELSEKLLIWFQLPSKKVRIQSQNLFADIATQQLYSLYWEHCYKEIDRHRWPQGCCQ